MRFAPTAVCLLSLVAVSTQAFAQSRPERPYRGLFASGTAGSAQTLSVSGSAGGGYDDNILLDLPGGGTLDPRLVKSGKVATGDGSISYAFNGDRVTFGASGGSMVRFYPSNGEDRDDLRNDLTVTAHGATVGGSVRMGRRTTFSGSQSANYQPFTFSLIFPTFVDATLGQLTEPGLDQATSRDEYWSHITTATLSHNFTPRLSFNTGYTFYKSETAYVARGSFSRHSANAGFRYAMSRNLALRFGYGIQEARFPDADSARAHTLDVGADYNKALSFSRRTTLTFSTGTAAVNSGRDTSFNLTGTARLNHEIGRTWTASAGYSRSVQFVDLLLVPVLYDSADASIIGLLNRRVEVQAGAKASLGTTAIGNQGSRGDFDTFQALASVSYSLSRFVQLGTTYSFYRYRFDRLVQLPLGVPRNIDRQSIRAQVSFWAPIINRARR